MPKVKVVSERDLPEITLDAFVAQMKEQLEIFEQTWRTNHAVDPQNWPLSMPEGDWDEQLGGFDVGDPNYHATPKPGAMP